MEEDADKIDLIRATVYLHAAKMHQLVPSAVRNLSQ
jgi:hypothetical protein